ncbi:MAG: hypothetical protein FD155_2834 [Bacteroidetes bacterium]|nr:MAG: hypothetical protein FD155_2834 [Bacteroidota bacterium]
MTKNEYLGLLKNTSVHENQLIKLVLHSFDASIYINLYRKAYLSYQNSVLILNAKAAKKAQRAQRNHTIRSESLHQVCFSYLLINGRRLRSHNYNNV